MTPKFIKYREYKSLDDNILERVCSVLDDDLWKRVDGLDDLEASVTCFNLIVEGMLDILVPLRKRRVKINPPKWNLSVEAKSARSIRDKAHRVALKVNTPEAWLDYKKKRNKATSVLRSCRAKYIAELASDMKGKSGTFWKCFSHLSGSARKECADVPHSVNDFNSHFLSVALDLSSKILPSGSSPMSFMEDNDIPTFEFHNVEKEEIHCLVQSLDGMKATGTDGIPARLLKACSCVFLSPIVSIMNSCLARCKVPSVWKQANVFPLQKSSHDNSLTNFRPISVLPILSKILERLVYNQVLVHFTRYKIITPVQAGFRPGYSTQDVLVHATDTWRKAIDNRSYVGCVFLDLKKAFDCVDHDIMLAKLPYYGIRKESLQWFRDYLQGRTQRVCLGDSISDLGEISIGVPQGSVLGPLLFSVYINDLPNVIKSSNVLLYADDTAIYSSNPFLDCLQSDLQKALNAISEWMLSNKITVNLSKSVSMLIGVPQKIRNQTLKLYLNGTGLSCVKSYKYLGVRIDSHLTWKDHIDELSKCVRFRYQCLLRLLPLPPRIFSLVYNSHVLSKIDYCDVIWGAASKSSLLALNRIHSKACKLMACSSANSTFPSLRDRRNFHIALLAFKVLHHLSPPFLNNSINFASDITHRTTRNKYRVFLPSVRTNLGKCGFYFHSVSIWNSLHEDLYLCNSVKTFKSVYKFYYF